MKRTAMFVVLLLVFLAWTFPHELVVRRILRSRLGTSGVEATVAAVRPSFWPLGYRLDGLALSRDGFRADIQSVHVGVGLSGNVSFNADACSGSVRGSLDRDRGTDGATTRNLEVHFDDVDPSTCLELAGPAVAGKFSGVLALEGIGHGKQTTEFARVGTLTLEGRAGSLSGYLPSGRITKPSGKHREPQPIGRWEFARLNIDARLADARIVVTHADAEAEGLEWETGAAKVDLARGTPRIEVELRAKRIDDSARSKAILALLPRAVEKEGWRRYRIVGTPSSLQLVGLK